MRGPALCRHRGTSAGQPCLRSQPSPLRPSWACDGEALCSGRIYVAPQDARTTVNDAGAFCVSPSAERPSPNVDRLFTSVALTFASNAIGIVLSGWLADGAAGARHIVEAGGAMFVQDRATSHQFEMPQAALRAGIGALVLPAPVI